MTQLRQTEQMPVINPSELAATPLEVEHAVAIAQRRCEDQGVQLVFSAWERTACTNGQTITIPALKQPITKKQLDILRGYIIHETGHHLRPTAFSILKQAQPPEHLCSLMNITEDDSMERQQAGAWAGDRQGLALMNRLILGDLIQEWKAQNALGNPESAKPLACLYLNQLSRLEWDEHSEIAIRNLYLAYPQPVRDLIDELEPEGWVGRLRATKTPEDSWNLAIDLAKRLYPGKDEAYERIRNAGLGDSGPDTEANNQFEDSQTASQSGQGSVSNVPSGTPDEQDTAAGTEGGVVSWKDIVLSEHNEWEASHSDGGLGPDWRGYKSTGDAGLMPLSEVNVVDLGKSRSSRGNDRWYYERYLPHNEGSRALANQIRRYMQAKAKRKPRRHERTGRLDKSSLVKLALPPIEGGDYNRKLFYVEDDARLKDTAIFVLVDWSGSMSGAKMRHAADAAQRLVYVMERILRLPVFIACFSNGRSQCDVGIVKPWNTRGLTELEIARRFAKFGYYTSANNDADALNWAYHQLKQRNESRKLLIVLSDGAPAGSWAGHADTNLSYMTRVIEADPKVELYGIGIKSDAVQRYYTNHTVVNEANQINQAIFDVIKRGQTHEVRRR